MEAQVALVGAGLLAEPVGLVTKEVIAPQKELMVELLLEEEITPVVEVEEALVRLALLELHLLPEKAGTEPHHQLPAHQ